MQPAPQQRPRAHAPPTRPRQGSPYGAPPRPPVGGQPVRRVSPEQMAQMRAKRKKTRRRRRVLALLVLLLLAAGLVTGVVLLVRFFLPDATAAPVATPVPSATIAAPPAASGTVSVSLPGLDLPAVPTGAHDEAEMPLLFNYNHEIPQSYLDALLNGGMADVGGGQQMEKRAAAAYNDMSAAAGADGITLTPVSGFRTNQRQTNNYNNSIQNYLNQGFSHDEAMRRTEGYYAIPGTSEHEAGLAIDIGFIEDSFEDTPAFAWLQEHAEEYGFILRYREEDFAITHIHYEPWHYRYVGTNHAAAINSQGITLEEYVG